MFPRLQDLRGGKENPARARGRSDPGADADRCQKRGGADEAPGSQRPGRAAAPDPGVPEADGGHPPEGDRTDQGRWQLTKTVLQNKMQSATTPPPSCI